MTIAPHSSSQKPGIAGRVSPIIRGDPVPPRVALGMSDRDTRLVPIGKPPARSVAKGSATEVWIDHARIEEDDLDWLAPVQALTLWAVDVPDGFLAGLPDLRLLDLRGGSANTAAEVSGCSQLYGLVLNQIRGLQDLSEIAGLTGLRLLSLYGLPQVRVPPSLERLQHLARLELGSMKGLETLEPLLRATSLRELLLVRQVAVSDEDVELIAQHPSLAAFGWFAEDVPDKTWVSVLERIDLPATRARSAKDWLASNTG